MTGKNNQVLGRFIGFALEGNKKFAVFMDCMIDSKKQDSRAVVIMDADELIVSQAHKHTRDYFFKAGKIEGKSDKQIESEFVALCRISAAKEYPDYTNPPTLEDLRKQYNIEVPEDKNV